jgi:hypothetical protein
MFLACVIISGFLAVALVGSAMAKLRRMEQVVVPITSVGVPLEWFPFLAGLELLGAAGLVIGLAVPAIGIAAAIGVMLYFVGAVVAHLRAGDSTIAAPAFLAFMALGALILRIYSM